jgi:hypothetical protein
MAPILVPFQLILEMRSVPLYEPLPQAALVNEVGTALAAQA